MKFTSLSAGKKTAIGLAATIFCSLSYGQCVPTAYTTCFVYDAGARLVGSISPDPDGAGPIKYAAVRNTYNNLGLLSKTEYGELASIPSAGTLPSAWTGFTIFRQEDYIYNPLGQKVQTQLSSGGAILTTKQTSYDSVGRPSCVTQRMNPSQFASGLPADACTLGTAGQYGDDRITRYSYDSNSNLIKVQRAYGTAMQVDAATYTYYSSGSRMSAADGNGNYSYYTYDGFDRLEYLYMPSAATAGQYNSNDYEKYSYDDNGNSTSIRRRDGNVLSYTYDGLNNRTSVSVAGVRTVYHGYDLSGHRIYSRYDSNYGPGASVSYDGFGRVKSVSNDTNGTSRVLSYSYDKEGNRIGIIFPDGVGFTYTYDGLNRLSGVLENGTSVITLVYDNQGRRQTMTRGASVASTGYSYDGASRVYNLAHNLAGTAYDDSRTYQYNAAGQLTSRSFSNSSYSYSQSSTVTTNYGSNGLNQYTSIASSGFVQPTYDAAGNLTFDGSQTYGFDNLNRLTSISGGRSLTVGYDPLNQWSQTTGTTSGTIQYLFSGNDLAIEYDVGGSILRRYITSPITGEALIWYEGSSVGAGSRRYLYSDQQLTVSAASDSNGNGLLMNSYDAYGVPATGNATRIQYTGQIRVPEFALYNYKARIYNPQLGRFLQVDPVGYKENLNLYQYAESDPLNNSDPSGESCSKSAPETAWNCKLDRIIGKDGNEIDRSKLSAKDQAKLARFEALYTEAVNDLAANPGRSGDVDIPGGNKLTVTSSGVLGKLVARFMEARLDSYDNHGSEVADTYNYKNTVVTRVLGATLDEKDDYEVKDTVIHEGMHGEGRLANGQLNPSTSYDLMLKKNLSDAAYSKAHQQPFRQAIDKLLGGRPKK